MATITNTTVVCDICRDPERTVNSYRVGYGGQKQKAIVLCSEHGAPLDEAIHAAIEVIGSDRSGRYGRVWTMEEIDQLRP